MNPSRGSTELASPLQKPQTELCTRASLSEAVVWTHKQLCVDGRQTRPTKCYFYTQTEGSYWVSVNHHHLYLVVNS